MQEIGTAHDYMPIIVEKRGLNFYKKPSFKCWKVGKKNFQMCSFGKNNLLFKALVIEP